MKWFCLFLLSASFLSASETYGVEEVDNALISQNKPVIGEVYLCVQRPSYAGSDTQYFESAFNLEVKPADLLVSVGLVMPDAKHRKFESQFDHQFRPYLPFKLFKDKDENDIIKLAFYGKIVHLVCKKTTDDDFLKKHYPDVATFKDLYNRLLHSVFEFPKYTKKDVNFLVDKKILARISERCSYESCQWWHGTLGYASLLEHASNGSLLELSHACQRVIHKQFKPVEEYAEERASHNGVLWSELQALRHSIECLSLIIEKQHEKSKPIRELSNQN
jgi:hypothetical protein